jgi:hypothetical protein
MAERKRKLLALVRLSKPYSQMTEHEKAELARYIVAQAKAKAEPEKNYPQR